MSTVLQGQTVLLSVAYRTSGLCFLVGDGANNLNASEVMGDNVVNEYILTCFMGDLSRCRFLSRDPRHHPERKSFLRLFESLSNDR